MEDVVICLVTLAAFLFGGFAADRFGSFLDKIRKGAAPPAEEKRETASQ